MYTLYRPYTEPAMFRRSVPYAVFLPSDLNNCGWIYSFSLLLINISCYAPTLRWWKQWSECWCPYPCNPLVIYCVVVGPLFRIFFRNYVIAFHFSKEMTSTMDHTNLDFNTPAYLEVHMFSIALDSASIIEVGWQGGFTLLRITLVTSMVGICPFFIGLETPS